MARRGVHSARHRADPAPPRISAGDGAPSTATGSADKRSPRARGGRSRGVAIRAVAFLGASAVELALGVAGAGSTGAPVAATVKAFLLDWETGNYAGAAALTTGNPEVVRSSLQAAFRQLGAADLVLGMGPISVHGRTATARFHASVNLGRGGLPWQYTGLFDLRGSGSQWRVVWRPDVIVPGLAAGDRLAVLTTVPSRAPVLDSGGRPLLEDRPVVQVGVRPGGLTRPWTTARQLTVVLGLGGGGAAAQMRDDIVAAPSDSFLELVTLSPAQYSKLAGRLSRIAGVVIIHTTARLFVSSAQLVTGAIGTESAQVLFQNGQPYRPGTTVGLSGLERAFQARLAGQPSTEVVELNASGRQVRVLRRWAGQVGAPVTTTIDGGVQRAVNLALTGSAAPAAIVAIRPGSGQILAVAAHDIPGMPVIQPLAGQYQPGQSFLMVSTAAELDSGTSPAARFRCVKKFQIGVQAFANVPDVGQLGPAPTLETDFTHACGTAFATLSEGLPARSLNSAVAAFGIGAPWLLPIAAFSGSMRPLSAVPSPAEEAGDAIGGGTVRVSPLAMALGAGLVASGSWHAPTLVTSPVDPGLSGRTPLSAQVLGELRYLMAQSVRTGAARQANAGKRQISGQVGMAPLGTGHLQAIWFVGYSGNVAFAVLVLAPKSQGFYPAAHMAGAFARALP